VQWTPEQQHFMQLAIQQVKQVHVNSALQQHRSLLLNDGKWLQQAKEALQDREVPIG
jgi:hypothetical protein